MFSFRRTARTNAGAEPAPPAGDDGAPQRDTDVSDSFLPYPAYSATAATTLTTVLHAPSARFLFFPLRAFQNTTT